MRSAAVLCAGTPGDAPADPAADVGQRPGGPLPLAPDVAFHGPMLTKTAYGQENVEAIHKLIGGIQVRT